MPGAHPCEHQKKVEELEDRRRMCRQSAACAFQSSTELSKPTTIPWLSKYPDKANELGD